MRGIARVERSEVINLLQQGISPSVIIKELGLPKSTVCDWANQLKKENLKKSASLKRTGTMDSWIKNAEVKITNASFQIVSKEVSDEQWFEFEDVIHKELTVLVDSILKSLELTQ